MAIFRLIAATIFVVVLASCIRDKEIPEKDIDYVEIGSYGAMWYVPPPKFGVNTNVRLSDYFRIYSDNSAFFLENKSEYDKLRDVGQSGLYEVLLQSLIENGFGELDQLSKRYPEDWCEEIADIGTQYISVRVDGVVEQYFYRCSDEHANSPEGSPYDQRLLTLYVAIAGFQNQIR